MSSLLLRLRTGQLRHSVRLGRSCTGASFRRASHTTSEAFHRSPPSSIVLGALGVSLLGGLAIAFASPVALDAPSPSERANAAFGGKRAIDYNEVAKHNTRESCWIIVRGKVYDVTNFLDKHPGGARTILKNSGQDVTAIYESLHSSGLLHTMLTADQYLGIIDPATAPMKDPRQIEDEERVKHARETMPPLSSIINLKDMEEVAKLVLPASAWAYYRGGAEDEYTQRGNEAAFKHYWFQPRVLRPVATIDTSTTIMGIPTAVPIFVSPAAMAGLGHPLGEVNITRGAARTGIIQGISTNASRTIDDIANARSPGQPLFFQLYISKDTAASEAVVRKVEDLGFKAIMFTVDAPVLGKREMDMKAKAALLQPDDDDDAEPPSHTDTLAGYFEVNLTWDHVKWLKGITKLPIIIKGIQTVEDVELAAEYGAQGVLLSNHGGRQLEYAPSGIDVLYDLRQRRPDLFDKLEVYIDGGVRRGTDVLKALCLGAKGVGLGRPFLYANGAYGEKGVVKTVRILQDEIVTGMRLLGVTKIEELKPEMVRYLDRVPPYPSSAQKGQ